MAHDAEWAERTQRQLRDLLNAWDPIGVFDLDDEYGPGPAGYDCMREPLISRLLRGDSRDEIARFLRDELSGHFGLDPGLATTDVIDRIFDWWQVVR